MSSQRGEFHRNIFVRPTLKTAATECDLSFRSVAKRFDGRFLPDDVRLHIIGSWGKFIFECGRETGGAKIPCLFARLLSRPPSPPRPAPPTPFPSLPARSYFVLWPQPISCAHEEGKYLGRGGGVITSLLQEESAPHNSCSKKCKIIPLNGHVEIVCQTLHRKQSTKFFYLLLAGKNGTRRTSPGTRTAR
jgi:hypothetical protein